jgi:hypothetical protein
VTAPTELFIPNYRYLEGYGVAVSDGDYEIDRETQTLIYRHSEDQVTHHITVWDERMGSLAEVEQAAKRERQMKGLAVASVIVAAGLGLRRLFKRWRRR